MGRAGSVQGLLTWCQTHAAGYESVDIKNFSTSFNDGLALCAILHRYFHVKYLVKLHPLETRRSFQFALLVLRSAYLCLFQ